MSKKDLKKLSREQLLVLMIELKKENEKLKAENQELRASSSRQSVSYMPAAEPGTLAEAAINASGILEAADNAAAQYLESVKAIGNANMQLYRQQVEQAEKDADRIIEQAKEKAKAIIRAANTFQDK